MKEVGKLETYMYLLVRGERKKWNDKMKFLQSWKTPL